MALRRKTPLKPRSQRKCSVCKASYRPRSSTQKVCGKVACALEVGRKEAAKQAERERLAQKRENRAAKEALKSRGRLTQEAQEQFNHWIRLRDRAAGCISCHMPPNYEGKWHASHYQSTGAHPELRFDPANVHKSCAQCNTSKSGNKGPYRTRLIEKIGQAEVDRLEGPNPPQHYSLDDLREIRDRYRKLVREMKREMGIR